MLSISKHTTEFDERLFLKRFAYGCNGLLINLSEMVISLLVICYQQQQQNFIFLQWAHVMPCIVFALLWSESNLFQTKEAMDSRIVLWLQESIM